MQTIHTFQNGSILMNVLSSGMCLSPKIQLFPITCRMEVLGHQAKFLLPNLTILKVKQVRIQQLISQRPKKEKNTHKKKKTRKKGHSMKTAASALSEIVKGAANSYK